jgi:hypothetical protein
MLPTNIKAIWVSRESSEAMDFHRNYFELNNKSIKVAKEQNFNKDSSLIYTTPERICTNAVMLENATVLILEPEDNFEDFIKLAQLPPLKATGLLMLILLTRPPMTDGSLDTLCSAHKIAQVVLRSIHDADLASYSKSNKFISFSLTGSFDLLVTNQL